MKLHVRVILFNYSIQHSGYLTSYKYEAVVASFVCLIAYTYLATLQDSTSHLLNFIIVISIVS